MKEGLKDTQTTLLRYAGFNQRRPAFDPSGAYGVKICSRQIFQDQASYKRDGGFGTLKLWVLKIIELSLIKREKVRFIMQKKPLQC